MKAVFVIWLIILIPTLLLFTWGITIKQPNQPIFNESPITLVVNPLLKGLVLSTLLLIFLFLRRKLSIVWAIVIVLAIITLGFSALLPYID